VRCNAIAPGWVKTDLNKAIWSNDEFAAQWVANQPIKRWGETDDLVGAAIWLASDAAAYTTGQTIIVDGGATVGH
jgi:NAD(P)-dependent dehydrogenase (short-subunit alcohol dehydrogenase family)